MVNRVILIGNLGKDPEVRHLENGAVVAKFSLATNENYRDKSGEWQTLTDWHDIVVWRSLAERAGSSLKKGMTIYLEGKLSRRSWDDKEGNKRYTTEVVANYFRIIGRRESSGGDQGGGYFPSANDEVKNNNSFDNNNSSFDSSSSSATPVSSGQETSGGNTEAVDDDLPF